MRVLILSAPRSGSTYLYNVVTKYYANAQIRNKELYAARDELLYVDENYILDTLKSHVDFNSHIQSVMSADIKKQYTQLGFTQHNVEHMIKHIEMAKKDQHVVFKDHIMALERAYFQQNNIYKQFVDAIDYTILLLRQNIFDASLSAAIAYVKKDFANYKYNTDKKIRFTKEEFLIAWYTHYINYKKLIDNKLNIKIDEVVYYEDFYNKEPIDIYCSLNLCNKNYDDLPELGANTIKAPSKKDIVENYTELEEYAYELAHQPQFAELDIVDHVIQARY